LYVCRVRSGCAEDRVVLRPLRLVLASLLLAGACTGRHGANPPPAAPTTGSTAPTTASSSVTVPAPVTTTAPAVSPGPAAGEDWLTYHHDTGRSGVAGDQAPLGGVKRAWESPTLGAKIYAQPLLTGDRVLVATEANSVAALDRASGTVVWRAELGDSVPGSTLPCGNIDPSGITGTPVVDPAAGTVDVVAFLRSGPHHELFALDLATGAVRWHRPVDPPGLAAKVEQERGALTLAGGQILVPFGGLFGDCGQYKGAIVAVPANGQGDIAAYVVPTRREGGIWTPGGVVVDGAGGIWVTTGNTDSGSDFDYGNAVIHLDPALTARDWFAPKNWAALNRADTDLGSVGPVLAPGDRIFAIGKEGIGFVLDRAALGHLGGGRFSARVCESAYGTVAASGNLLAVPCVDSLVALRLTGDRFDVAWRSDDGTASPIVAGGAVWAVDASGTLSAWDPSTGAVRFSDRIGPVTHFTSAAASRGLLVVATGERVVGFTLR